MHVFSPIGIGCNGRLSDSGRRLTSYSFGKLGAWAMLSKNCNLVENSWSFEIEILGTPEDSDNLDNLGISIGFTATSPGDAPPAARTCDEIPLTCVAGYDGRSWCVNRGWKPCKWESHRLVPGDRVTALMTSPSAGGVFAIFVNEKCVQAVSSGFTDFPVWGVVDLLTSEGISSIRLRKTASHPSLTFALKKVGMPIEYTELELLRCQELQAKELFRRLKAGRNVEPVAEKLSDRIITIKDADSSGLLNIRVCAKIAKSCEHVLGRLDIATVHPKDPIVISSVARLNPTNGLLLSPDSNELFTVAIDSPTMFISLPEEVTLWRLCRGRSILVRTADKDGEKAANFNLGISVSPTVDGECDLFVSIQVIEHAVLKRWALRKGIHTLVDSYISHLSQ